MDAATRRAVRERAANSCEYCQRQQAHSPLIPLQIEHIVARKHHGGDELDNLALACSECNLHKGSDLTGIDPLSGEITVLFHPRQHRWDEHFRWEDFRIIGVSATGRTTAQLLQLNSAARLRVRLAVGRQKHK